MHLSLNNSLGKWILPKEPAPFSPEATNYFSRLDAAGDTTYVDYRQPLANYIDSLVALGGAYWDTMESAASFVGVGIQGITVPLRDGMPVLTENNFIDLDLDQLTGLKGNSTSGKYLSTNTDTTDYAQNDNSLSFYVTDLDTATSADQSILCGIRSGTGGNPFHFQYRSSAQRIDARNFSGGGAGGVSSADGFFGSARDNSSNFTYRRDSTDLAVAIVSGAQANADLLLFAADNTIGGSVGSYSDARLATYHAGPALDLATLEGLQATLLSEIATVNLILDEYPAEAAYSFRVLSSSFANAAVVRVRRDSDNAELDFTAEDITTSVLINWVGAGNDGFVETWYDQSGNSNNATQLTAGSQPKIVENGALLSDGLNFIAPNNWSLNTDYIPPASLTAFSVSFNDTSDGFTYGARDSANERCYLSEISGNYRIGVAEAQSVATSGSTANGLQTFAYNGTRKYLYENNVELINLAQGQSVDNVTQGMAIGAFNNSGTVSSNLRGTIDEIIFYSSDKLSDRVAIETNINNAYNLY